MQLEAVAGWPNTTRTRLKRHSPRRMYAGTPRNGLILGVAFLAIGVGILLVALDVIKVDPSAFHGPRGLVAAFGGLFALVGLVMAALAAVAWHRQARRKNLLLMSPRDPWLADYPWDPGGIGDDRRGRILRIFASGLFLAAFLAPFHWFALTGAPVMALFLVVFDAAGLGMIGYGVYLLCRHHKYGASWLAFDRFPYHPGETLGVRFSNAGLNSYRRITFTLRFIQEVIESHGQWRNRTAKVVCYQLYADRRECPEPGEFNWAAGPVPVSFPLPEGRYANELSTNPPRYWELEVHADTPGVDYRGHFVVPVYGPADPT